MAQLDVQATIDAATAMDVLSAQRQDHMVARQGVMNHQNMAHFMDFVFVRDSVEMSIPEAAATANLNQGQLAGLVAGLNTGNSTPSSPGSTTQQKAA